MKPLLALVCIASLAGATWSGVYAQSPKLQLTIENGRVTIVALDVPLREVLEEWSRIGQTRIVNGDRLAGPPVTLQLVNKTEREALDVLLRATAGYIVAPRPDDRPGPSAYDRIIILASSRAPAVTAAAAPAPAVAASAPTPQPRPDPPDSVSSNEGDRAVDGTVAGAATVPQEAPQQTAASPFPGVPPQLEAAQPRDPIELPGMRGQQGPSATPIASPRPGMMPAPPPAIPYGYPYQPPRTTGRGGGGT